MAAFTTGFNRRGSDPAERSSNMNLVVSMGRLGMSNRPGGGLRAQPGLTPG
jgi:hypothetical protein